LNALHSSSRDNAGKLVVVFSQQMMMSLLLVVVVVAQQQRSMLKNVASSGRRARMAMFVNIIIPLNRASTFVQSAIFCD